VVGYTGIGDKEAPHYDVKLAYPSLTSYYGLMSGVLFALPLSIFSIVMGVTSDKVNRKAILCTGCILWSSISILTGWIDNFPIFVFLRILLGIACAFCNPAAYSLIRDYFPPTRRGTANSIYSSGIYIGNALSSASISIIADFGWRQDFITPGCIGVILGILGFVFLREPERGHFSKVTVEPPKVDETAPIPDPNQKRELS
jgi:MFS family permease